MDSAKIAARYKFRSAEGVWRKVRGRYSAVVREGIPCVINGRQVRSAKTQKESLRPARRMFEESPL